MIARMGEGGAVDPALEAGAGGEATRQLLGQYQTPARSGAVWGARAPVAPLHKFFHRKQRTQP